MKQAKCAFFLLFQAFSAALAQDPNEPNEVFEAIGADGVRNPAIRAEAVRQSMFYRLVYKAPTKSP